MGKMMSDVAAFELCRTLYGLSSWNSDDFWWAEWIADSDTALELKYFRGGAYGKTREWDYTPAYTLGFMMRKLPDFDIYKRGDKYEAWYFHNGMHIHLIANTPANAVANLAIELFKEGILS
jgi:hypothetical protein